MYEWNKNLVQAEQSIVIDTGIIVWRLFQRCVCLVLTHGSQKIRIQIYLDLAFQSFSVVLLR